MPIEKQNAVLAELASGAMSSLGYVGSLLDKYTGSRALRGVLGGHPEELLSIIPGSDLMGLTDPANVVSGKDVNEKLFGLKDNPDSWMDDILGFGTEVLLDPTLPLTGFLKGGLSSAGKIAEKAGVLKDLDYALTGAKATKAGKLASRSSVALRDVLDMIPVKAERALIHEKLKGAGLTADMLSQPIGKSLEVGVPFTKLNKGVNVPLLDTARDKLFDKISGSPVARTIKRYLHAPVKSMRTKAAQRVAEHLTAVQGRVATDIGDALDHYLRLSEAGELTPQHAASLYSKLEGFDKTLASEADEMFMNDAIRWANKAYQKDVELGLDNGKLLDDYIEQFFPRKPYFKDKPGGAREWIKLMQDGFSANKARSDPFRNIKGGTATIIKISQDPVVRDIVQTNEGNKRLTSLMLQTHLTERYASVLPKHMEDQKLLKDFADSLANAPAEVFSRGYYQHPVEAFIAYKVARTNSQAVASHELDLINEAIHSVKPGKPTTTLSEVFYPRKVQGKWTGGTTMRPHGVIPSPEKIMEGAGTIPERNPFEGGGLVELVNRYGNEESKQTLNRLKRAWDTATQTPYKDMDNAQLDRLANIADEMLTFVDEVGQTPVDKGIIDDLRRLAKKEVTSEEVSDIMKWIDSYTNLFKVGVLSWPSRYTRDLASGQIQNALFDQWDPESAMQTIRFMFTGKVRDPKKYLDFLPRSELKRMTEAEAMRRLRAHIASMGIVDRAAMTMSQVGDLAKGEKSVLRKGMLEGIAEGMPQPQKVSDVVDILRSGTLWDWNPLNARGVGIKNVRTETTNPLYKAANYIGNTTDAANRLVPFFNLSKRGFAPNVIRDRIMAAQVDYSSKAFTAFEKKYMQRIFPFYRYTKSMIPVVGKELMNNPSGPLAQVVRGSARLTSGKGVFTPSYINQTMAIPLSGPLGAKGEDVQRYVRGIGLMHEDPLSLFRPGQTTFDTVSDTLGEIGGKMNPLAKLGIELMTKKQLYTGREIKDLDSIISRLAERAGKKVAQVRGIPEENAPLQHVNVDPLIDEILMNSPLSRAFSTLGKITNPSRGVGAKLATLLTGVKTSDVRMEKARNMAIREEIEKRMRGKPGVHSLRPHLYVREEDRDLLDPIDLLLMDMYKQQRREDARAARKKK